MTKIKNWNVYLKRRLQDFEIMITFYIYKFLCNKYYIIKVIINSKGV